MEKWYSNWHHQSILRPESRLGRSPRFPSLDSRSGTVWEGTGGLYPMTASSRFKGENDGFSLAIHVSPVLLKAKKSSREQGKSAGVEQDTVSAAGQRACILTSRAERGNCSLPCIGHDHHPLRPLFALHISGGGRGAVRRERIDASSRARRFLNLTCRVGEHFHRAWTSAILPGKGGGQLQLCFLFLAT